MIHKHIFQEINEEKYINRKVILSLGSFKHVRVDEEKYFQLIMQSWNSIF